jgi:hypothetical protein
LAFTGPLSDNASEGFFVDPMKVDLDLTDPLGEESKLGDAPVTVYASFVMPESDGYSLDFI